MKRVPIKLSDAEIALLHSIVCDGIANRKDFLEAYNADVETGKFIKRYKTSTISKEDQAMLYKNARNIRNVRKLMVRIRKDYDKSKPIDKVQ